MKSKQYIDLWLHSRIKWKTSDKHQLSNLKMCFCDVKAKKTVLSGSFPLLSGLETEVKITPPETNTDSSTVQAPLQMRLPPQGKEGTLRSDPSEGYETLTTLFEVGTSLAFSGFGEKELPFCAQ